MMPLRTASPLNRIVFSVAVLAVGLGMVWYQRSHSAADGGKKPFLSQAPSSEAGNKFAWVPSYPGATVSDIRTKMTRGELSYGFSFRTPDGSDKILSFYENKLQTLGFKVDVKRGDAGGQVHAEAAGGKRSFDLTAGKVPEGSEAGAIAVEK